MSRFELLDVDQGKYLMAVDEQEHVSQTHFYPSEMAPHIHHDYPAKHPTPNPAPKYPLAVSSAHQEDSNP
jgi:hypothetical protein